MKQKIVSLCLASLLAVSLLACPAYAQSFPDVSSSAGYKTAVDYVSQAGVMVGDSQGNFNPNQTVSRAEMATIICRMLNMTENLPESSAFTDVPASHWANAYIGKASELGIVGGYGNGQFGPGDPVTLEQAVTMIVRTIGGEDTAVAWGGYPTGYLLVAGAGSLLNGIDTEQGQGMSRCAVAVLLYNYYSAQGSPDDGHVHQYVEKAVSGHYEQVQVGTKQVQVGTEPREYWQCNKCKYIAYTNADALAHGDPESPSFSKDCAFSGSMIYTEYVPVYEEQPVYENKWVADSTATVRVCSICGQQE